MIEWVILEVLEATEITGAVPTQCSGSICFIPNLASENAPLPECYHGRSVVYDR